MQFRLSFIVAALGAALLPGLLFAQCPAQLLWTNGSLSAYRAVKCEGENCTEATDTVLYYTEELKEYGCLRDGENCKCRAEGTNLVSGAMEMEADQPVQNRGCHTIDAFVVKIGEQHIQCVEFRYVPNPGNVDDFGQSVARNMRVSYKLKGEPKNGTSNLLVDDSAKVDGNAVLRTIGDMTVSYPMLSSSSQSLEQLVTREAPKPAMPANTTEETMEQDKPGPDDSSGSENKPGPDNGGESTN